MKRIFLLFLISSFVFTGCDNQQIDNQEPLTTVQNIVNVEPGIDDMTIQEKMMNVDGKTIYYKQIGTGKKPALLMVHGYGGSSDGFSAVYPELAKRFTIISVDMIGFGRSSKPTDFRYSYPNHANAYYKLLTRLGYDKFSIMGHSYGGEVCLNMAYFYPDHVTNLVMIDATGVGSLVNKNIPKPALDNTLDNTSEPMDFEKEAVLNQTTSKEELEKLMLVKSRRIELNYNELKLPTLIIWGRNDTSVSWKEGEKYSKLLVGSEFHIIEEGEHAPFRKHAQEFIQYVNDFFDKNPVTN